MPLSLFFNNLIFKKSLWRAKRYGARERRERHLRQCLQRRLLGCGPPMSWHAMVDAAGGGGGGGARVRSGLHAMLLAANLTFTLVTPHGSAPVVPLSLPGLIASRPLTGDIFIDG